jgi:hypothetical protein
MVILTGAQLFYSNKGERFFAVLTFYKTNRGLSPSL